MPKVYRRGVVAERSITGVRRAECSALPGAEENIVVCSVRTTAEKPPHVFGNLEAAFFVNNIGTASTRRMVAVWPKTPATCLLYAYAETPIGGGERRALFRALVCGVQGTDEFEKLKDRVETWMTRRAREMGVAP